MQNRLKRVEARLPAEVRQNGILVEEASAATLNIITLVSTDGAMDEVGLGDFLIRNVINEIRRIPGVGRATLYSTERSLRAGSIPTSCAACRSPRRRQRRHPQPEHPDRFGRRRRAAEPLGQRAHRADRREGPALHGGGFRRHRAPGEFRRLERPPARRGPDRTRRRRLQFSTRLNGGQAAGISVTLAPDGNALETAKAIRAKMEELSQFFPQGLKWDIPYDITPAVKASIEKVMHTLIEAVVLVFLVMFLFLQNIRYTLIPTIVVPIALMGTVTVMWLSGFSVNVLTMFGMVLPSASSSTTPSSWSRTSSAS